MKLRLIGCILAVSMAFTAAATTIHEVSAADAKAKAAGETSSLQKSHERFAKSMGDFMLRWMEAGQQWTRATAEMANSMQTACVQCHAAKAQYYQENAKAWTKQFNYYMKHMNQQLKKVDDKSSTAANPKK